MYVGGYMNFLVNGHNVFIIVIDIGYGHIC